MAKSKQNSAWSRKEREAAGKRISEIYAHFKEKAKQNK